MNEVHKSYEEEAKRNPDYDDDGYNNYLDYSHEQYPFGKRDDEEQSHDR